MKISTSLLVICALVLLVYFRNKSQHVQYAGVFYGTKPLTDAIAQKKLNGGCCALWEDDTCVWCDALFGDNYSYDEWYNALKDKNDMKRVISKVGWRGLWI